MPLLPLETYLTPDTLLTEPADAEDAFWWVLHTRPRAEKALARGLIARRLAFFLPLYQQRRRPAVRLRTSFLPLFPGYVFLRADDAGRVAALETDLVARTLPVTDQAGLHAQLGAIHRLMVGGTDLLPETRPGPGTRVRVVAGPLEGLEGTVLRREGRDRLLVEVRLLRQGVSVDLDAALVERLEEVVGAH